MARKPDVIDRILEHWASWRITLELYEGTGPSSIVRFKEPAGTVNTGSRPLFYGNANRRLAALNADLCINLEALQVNCLLVLYGLPGEDNLKARRFGLSLSKLGTIRKQGRVIARQHISPTIRLSIGGHDDQLRRTAAG
ncbi:hypothetical protein NX722_05540 [Endozoicomonas gorgoniicola]|uniref:Uncharacterized protein n=1 Tax=Endozoicomonas gorgoniicola TaxID=1234144 RepID=A0ABT3MRY6_9GAMM|nr:hypothetical protein [Endozoicomonas gorgoniicola]MCW7552115.1 hypothetical protein [Endozoicomonas gorgoniicola]